MRPVLGKFGIIAMGLQALAIPHRSERVQARIDWLAKSVTS
jgi:hypothetical protein